MVLSALEASKLVLIEDCVYFDRKLCKELCEDVLLKLNDGILRKNILEGFLEFNQGDAEEEARRLLILAKGYHEKARNQAGNPLAEVESYRRMARDCLSERETILRLVRQFPK